MSESAPAPPEMFNFARHLLEANAGRPDKVAFADDAGALTYGALEERARRFAAALKDAGVKREERIMILMHDSADWPVAFLDAMLAGIVPVPVNTLLTADDYAYMLEHSRAQTVIVSGNLPYQKEWFGRHDEFLSGNVELRYFTMLSDYDK